MRSRPVTALALVFAGTFGAAAPPPRDARAEAVKLQMLTRVPTGERPRVRFLIQERVDRLEVELTRDDGKVVKAEYGPLAPGSARDLVLDGDPGIHRYGGRITVQRGGTSRDSTFSLETVVAPRLEVAVDKARVDLGARKLEVRLSRPAGRIEVRVFASTGGAPLAEEVHDFSGRPAGEPLEVTWPAPGHEAEIGRIDLRVSDEQGFFQGLSLYPWSVHIPHEEVAFATDSAAIAPSEAPKLDKSLGLIGAALARHKEIGPIKLFIAGHTDTVGNAAYNLKLSQRRAQAIAAWFRKRGLRLPIFFEGFGEHAPLVATPDERDEPRNRRVDYILAVEEPALKATHFRASWKRAP